MIGGATLTGVLTCLFLHKIRNVNESPTPAPKIRMLPVNEATPLMAANKNIKYATYKGSINKEEKMEPQHTNMKKPSRWCNIV